MIENFGWSLQIRSPYISCECSAKADLRGSCTIIGVVTHDIRLPVMTSNTHQLLKFWEHLHAHFGHEAIPIFFDQLVMRRYTTSSLYIVAEAV